MTFNTNLYHYHPKTKEVEQVFERLEHHPVVKVNSRLSQDISRNKTIRYLSKKNNIWIKGGIIGLPDNVKLKRSSKGFDFFFK